jgi:hypothetical protein
VARMTGAARKALGLTLIVAVLLALLGINRLSGRDVVGQPVAEPQWPPPPAGSCLLHSDDFHASLVPCTEPHTAEVLRSWPARDLPRTSGAGWRQSCPTGMTMPVEQSVDATDWSRTETIVATTVLRGGGPVIGWAACSVTASLPFRPDRSLRYTGSLIAVPGGRPAATVGTCLTATGDPIDCTSPHRTERIGEFLPIATPRPDRSCAAFARAVIGSDTAFSTAVALVARETVGSVSRWVIDTDAGELINQIDCDVRAPAGHQLVGSVVGLADRPIPFG